MRGLAEIVGLRTGDCRGAVDAIVQMAAGDSEIDAIGAVHVEACLRCQAEVAAYRRILRAMRSLRYDWVPAPASGLAAVIAELEAAEHPSRALRAAYFGGLTVATAAAGAAGVLVWMSRRRMALAEAG